MASIVQDESERRERYLDTFPISEKELDQLLLLHGLSFRESSYSEPPLSKLHKRARPNLDQNWVASLEHAEGVILPECTSLFYTAKRRVSVIGCLEDEDSETYQQWLFLESIVSLTGRRGSQFLINFIYDAAISQCVSGTTDAATLVDLAHRFLLASLFFRGSNDNKTSDFSSLPKTPQTWINSLIKCCHQTGTGTVSRPVWVGWVTSTIPEVIRGLSSFYHYAIFSPQGRFRTNAIQPFITPRLDTESLFWDQEADPLSLSLACLPSTLSGDWYRLYCSDYDGLSFLSLQNALLTYSGATTIIIRTENKALFGFYTDCPWKESTSWFGCDQFDSFLFRLKPTLDVYHPTGEGKCYMYLKSPGSTSKNILKGLAIGGIAEDTPRVHIPVSFEHCKAASVDMTYTSGPLLGTDEESFFNIDAIEVWAVKVCRDEFLQKEKAGRLRAATKEEVRLRAAQVDRAAFVSDFQSGTFINNLYSHRDQARGRHDFVVAGEHHGYYVEDKRPSTRNISTPCPGTPKDSDTEEDAPHRTPQNLVGSNVQ